MLLKIKLSDFLLLDKFSLQKINTEISSGHILHSNIDLCCMVLFLKSSFICFMYY